MIKYFIFAIVVDRHHESPESHYQPYEENLACILGNECNRLNAITEFIKYLRNVDTIHKLIN
ncbi:protein of unknown function [Legionella micdadei]|uniref:Uncharacterized protein n=1 Tax=Legionella micdadei TaxID=451 RepID=A0A098GCQ2_LEGMI|nr:protein of unknown function [Legionella micdadei]